MSGLNIYQYANAEPIQQIDPDGFNAMIIGGTIGAVAGIIIGGVIMLSPAVYYVYTCEKSRLPQKDCYKECKHLLPSPSGDLQSSEYRKCYRECSGSL